MRRDTYVNFDQASAIVRAVVERAGTAPIEITVIDDGRSGALISGGDTPGGRRLGISKLGTRVSSLAFELALAMPLEPWQRTPGGAWRDWNTACNFRQKYAVAIALETLAQLTPA